MTGKRSNLLRDSRYRNYWVGSTAAGLGGAIIPVVTAFAVLSAGGGAKDLGLVLAVGSLVELALLPVGGVWTDRLPRRTVVLVVDVTRAAAAFLMAAALLSDNDAVWQFIALAAVNAAGKAFFRPATSGLLPQIVGKPDLQSANALLSFSRNGSLIAGPAIGGVLAAVNSPEWAYLFNAAAFLVNVLVLSKLRLADHPPRPRTKFLHEVREGALEVARRSWLWQNVISHGLWNFGFSMLYVLGPVYATRFLGGISSWAVVSSSLAVGLLVGAVVALRLAVKRPLVAGNWALTAGAAPFIAMLFHAPLPVIAVAAAVAAIGLDILGSLWNSTLQRLVPDAVLSRVSSYDWFVSLSMTPLAYLAAGPLSSWLGLPGAFLIPVVLILVPSIAANSLRSVRSIRTDSSPGDVLPAPAVAPSTPD